MAHKTNSFERFWRELKRRKVLHVITVYAAVSFVILQLVDIVERPLRLPDWTTALVIVLLCIGFVIAIFLSWVYDITPAGVKKTKPLSVVKHTDHTTTPTSSGWRIATYISGVIIIALVAFNFISRRNLNTDLSKLEKSIAVLPFFNDSPSDSTTYFINGLMEEILNNLQKIGAFSKVLSRTSTEQYREIAKPPIPKIAKDLDVNFIVEGSGQKYGNFYRVRVQLIEGKTDKHLWVNSYEREIKGTKDIYDTQSEIAQSIASALKATITPEEKRLIEKTPTASLTANDFYQRGQDELTKYEIYNFNKAALEKAEDQYHKALKYDATFAQAYAGLARVYWKKHSSAKEYFSENYLDSVPILCDIAFSFDNDLAEAHTIKGEYYADKGFVSKAFDEYDKALRANSNFWEAYTGKGNIYFDDNLLNSIDNFQKATSLNHGAELPVILRNISLEYGSAGFIDKAYYYTLEALKLDGDSASYFTSLATFEKYRNNLEKAIEFLQKAYSIDSTQASTALQLGHCCMFLNQRKETLKYYTKYIEILKALGTFTPIDMHRIGWAYYENRYRKEAKYYFDKQLEYSKKEIDLKRLWGQKLYPYYDMAGVYAFIGGKEKAYESLRLFNQRQRMPLWVVTFLKTDPLFNSIRSEPEFQQIVRDVETKYQAEHERVRKWLEETGQL